MPGPRSPLPDALAVTAAERRELGRLVRSPTAAQGIARRARMVLLLADGHSVSEAARRTGTGRWVVRRWAERFRQDRLAGLRDRPRAGRPPAFPPSGGGPYGGAGLHPAG